MMRINQKIREKLIKVLARLSYKKVHCQPKCKAVFYLNTLNQTKYLTGIVKPKSEKSGLKSWIFQLTGGDSWGLGMQSPTSSALCTHRAELALLIATLMEHPPALAGFHQGMKEFLQKKMQWLLEDFNRKQNIGDFCKTKRLTNLSICTTGEQPFCGAGIFHGLRYPRNAVECITSEASYP